MIHSEIYDIGGSDKASVNSFANLASLRNPTENNLTPEEKKGVLSCMRASSREISQPEAVLYKLLKLVKGQSLPRTELLQPCKISDNPLVQSYSEMQESSGRAEQLCRLRP